MGRKFVVEWHSESLIELDDEVINRVDDEWRKHLYDLRTTEAIVEHIVYNLVVNNWELSDLDGWADLPNSMAKITDRSTYWWDVVEITDENLHDTKN
jgi:hypothetical protein